MPGAPYWTTFLWKVDQCVFWGATPTLTYVTSGLPQKSRVDLDLESRRPTSPGVFMGATHYENRRHQHAMVAGVFQASCLRVPPANIRSHYLPEEK